MQINRDNKGIAHIVGLSGGKDSTAMAIWLMENEPRPYNFLCTPTGDELPEMTEHWDNLEKILGQPLIKLATESLKELNKRMGALPNFQMRFCTRILKLKPYAEFIEKTSPAISYIGLRDDEEEREGAVHGGDFVPAGSTLIQRFPLREIGFGIDDVLKFLMERQILIPDRTDCARCFYQRLGEWYLLWLNHPDIYADAEQEEILLGFTYRSPGRDTWPTDLRYLRYLFEQGMKPEISLNMMEKRKNMCRACTL